MNVISDNREKSLIALEALQHVYDPEIGLNVVDLGLIYQIDFNEEVKRVDCTMTLTTRFCPMGESIAEGVRLALGNSFLGYSINIELTFEPAWNQEMISEAGRLFLGR